MGLITPDELSPSTQLGLVTWEGITAGTSTAYTCGINSGELTMGKAIAVLIHTTCGDSPTLNWAGTGDYLIQGVMAGDMEEGEIYTLRFNADAQVFQLQGKGGGGTHGSQTYTVPGTYTFMVPAGVNELFYIVQAGGGGGNGYVSGTWWGSGGASGSCGIGDLAVTPGQQIPVTVGSGGAGTASVSSATKGGDSIFGSITAKGGNAAYISEGYTVGGQTIVGSGATINIKSSPGNSGCNLNNYPINYRTFGGNSVLGGGGYPGNNGEIGAGGGGATSSGSSGGKGGDGAIYVYW